MAWHTKWSVPGCETLFLMRSDSSTTGKAQEKVLTQALRNDHYVVYNLVTGRNPTYIGREESLSQQGSSNADIQTVDQPIGSSTSNTDSEVSLLL